MAKYAKWIAGAFGWAVGGPIGLLIGFGLGSLIDNTTFKAGFEDYSGIDPHQRRTQPGDFAISVIVLSAAVMKADGKVMKSELNYVKQFFLRQFGVEKTRELMKAFREILQRDIPLRDVCLQIRSNMAHPDRLQLLHYLFGIARADGQVHASETNTIAQIANYLGISQKDFASIKAMFLGDVNSAYKILEITKAASDVELKKAYRKMAVKHHPDKVRHLGEDVQKAAKEKFQKVLEAYNAIKKERGLA